VTTTNARFTITHGSRTYNSRSRKIHDHARKCHERTIHDHARITNVQFTITHARVTITQDSRSRTHVSRSRTHGHARTNRHHVQAPEQSKIHSNTKTGYFTNTHARVTITPILNSVRASDGPNTIVKESSRYLKSFSRYPVHDDDDDDDIDDIDDGKTWEKGFFFLRKIAKNSYCFFI